MAPEIALAAEMVLSGKVAETTEVALPAIADDIP
jgi:hypothetical protein